MGLSGRLARIGFQQSAKTLDANNLTLAAVMLWLDDSMEALVNPLMVVVLEILGQNVAQLVFGREDKMVETFLFDGPDESLRVGIQIRISGS
jgi:hypothetical protein